MANATYRKFSKADQKLLATWSAKCAERVLPLFEEAHPKDPRPREAIEACRTWVRTGEFKMAVIRAASLGSHAAARAAKANGNEVACLAARAAGQAVATAHVAQHAYGGALYALKAIAEANPENAEAKAAKEWSWQSRRLPEHLREEIMSRLLVKQSKRGVVIKLDKAQGF